MALSIFIGPAALAILPPVGVVAAEKFAAHTRKQDIDRLCAVVNLSASHTFPSTVRKCFHVCVEVEGGFLAWLDMSIHNELLLERLNLRAETMFDPNRHLRQVEVQTTIYVYIYISIYIYRVRGSCKTCDWPETLRSKHQPWPAVH